MSNGRLGNDFLSVAGAGDVNRDGYADLLVGSNRTRNAVALHIGGPGGCMRRPVWRELDREVGERFGEVLDGVGDVNGDGYDDVVIGAPGWGEDQGRAVLYPGRAGSPR